MNKNFDIPFWTSSYNGQVIMINNARWSPASYTWIPNTQFFANLKFVGWKSTRSAATLQFEALDGPFKGKILCMSLHHFSKVFPTQTITNGTLQGDWTFYKRGSAFSLGSV